MSANKRVARLRSDLAPEEALSEGAYWFQPRDKRSDGTPPELLEVMKRFWHTDVVSRASGNSSNRDMWKPSKREGEVRHARRQLHVQGGGEAAFSKFFEWPEYINFKRIWKSEKGEDIKDRGRTLFLSTRCKCPTTLKTDQCACKIHTQQDLYLKALREVDVEGRTACDCKWCSTPDGQAAWKKMWEHLGTFSEALACPKVDLREADPEDEVGFMRRKPTCSSMDCMLCGFGKEGGIPTCKALERSEQLVKWTRYEDGTSITTQPCRGRTRGRCGCATIARPGGPSLGCAVVGYYYYSRCCCVFAFVAIHICALVFGCVCRHMRALVLLISCMCLAFSVTIVRCRVLAADGWQPRVKGCRTAARVKFCEGARTYVRTR